MASQSVKPLLHSTRHKVPTLYNVRPFPKIDPFHGGSGPMIMILWAHPNTQHKRHLDRFSRFCTDERRASLYFTMGCPFSHQKLPLPTRDLDPI